MVSVKVCAQDSGRPVENAKVALYFDRGMLSGGFTGTEYTGRDGEAHFDTDPGPGRIYVNGKAQGDRVLKGLMVVYID